MALRTYMDVDLYEKEVVEVDIVERDIITVDINVVDTIRNRNWVINTVKTYYIPSEVPTKLNSTDFETAYEYVTGKIVVYLNGIKQRNFTELTSNTIRLSDAVKADDAVEVGYIRNEA